MRTLTCFTLEKGNSTNLVWNLTINAWLIHLGILIISVIYDDGRNEFSWHTSVNATCDSRLRNKFCAATVLLSGSTLPSSSKIREVIVYDDHCSIRITKMYWCHFAWKLRSSAQSKQFFWKTKSKIVTTIAKISDLPYIFKKTSKRQ